MILIEAVAAVLLLLGSFLILRALIAADIPAAQPTSAPAQGVPSAYRRAA